jgi:hypothetical protein
MNSRLLGLVRALAAVGALGIVSASKADQLRLESPTLPAPLWEAGQVNGVIEASGVEPIGDGARLLIAHDKAPELFVVDAASGRIMGAPLTSPRFPRLDGAGPKWEGMARDSDGNYYVIGAHNGKTDEERASKSVLIRFRLKDGDSPTIDDASIVRWDVARSLEGVLNRAGLDATAVAKRKVEGLAIRERQGAGGSGRRELFIGLREPNDKVRVFAADISNPPSANGELELKNAFTFVAEPREGVTSELTSLEYVPALAGFLVVTASEDKANAFHGNILWFVADGEAGQAQKIATFEVAMKAEGLAVLGVVKDDQRTAVKLVITYDNDAHATKMPSRIQTATLVRESR